MPTAFSSAAGKQGKQNACEDQRADDDEHLAVEGTRILDLAVLLGAVGCPLEGCPRNRGDKNCSQQAEWRIQFHARGDGGVLGSLDKVLHTADGKGKGIKPGHG